MAREQWSSSRFRGGIDHACESPQGRGYQEGRMIWRPEGWANPYGDIPIGSLEKAIYEDGADAMLEGISKCLKDIYGYTFEDGVLIEEEE